MANNSQPSDQPANIILEDGVLCPICDSEEFDFIRSHKIAEHLVHKLLCKGCGFIYSNPLLSQEEMHKISLKRATNMAKPDIRLSYRSAIRALPRFNRVRNIIKSNKEIKIIDIGARTGEFIYLLLNKGYSVHGIEVNKEFINYASNEYGVAIEQQFFDELTLAKESADLITCYHLLHLISDPQTFLEKIYNALKTGGYLNLEIPNIEAKHRPTQQKLKAKNLHMFNVYTITSLAKLAGFTVKNTILIPGTLHINLILKKENIGMDAHPITKKSLRNSKNYNLVKNTVKGYRSLDYLISAAPYSKLLNKIKRHFRECRQLHLYSSAKQVVNTLFNRK
jgi:2-polyprenyl-3-methyl-5-hydroxy-6-metoxy-1,4-benzoquinol methylase